MSIRASFQQQAKRYAGRGARNMMAAAGIGLLAATAAVAPSYAQQANQDRPGHTAACMQYREDNGDRLQCEYNASVARTEANKARIRVADQRIAKANEQIVELQAKDDCRNAFTKAFQSGAVDKAKLSLTLNGRKPSEFGWCNLKQEFGLN